MNNFELNEKAQQMADTNTAYNLARRVVELEERLKITQSRLDDANYEISFSSLSKVLSNKENKKKGEL